MWDCCLSPSQPQPVSALYLNSSKFLDCQSPSSLHPSSSSLVLIGGIHTKESSNFSPEISAKQDWLFWLIWDNIDIPAARGGPMLEYSLYSRSDLERKGRRVVTERREGGWRFTVLTGVQGPGCHLAGQTGLPGPHCQPWGASLSPYLQPAGQLLLVSRDGPLKPQSIVVVDVVR